MKKHIKWIMGNKENIVAIHWDEKNNLIKIKTLLGFNPNAWLLLDILRGLPGLLLKAEELYSKSGDWGSNTSVVDHYNGLDFILIDEVGREMGKIQTCVTGGVCDFCIGIGSLNPILKQMLQYFKKDAHNDKIKFEIKDPSTSSGLFEFLEEIEDV